MSWLQASLPVRQGGLGLREAVRMSSSAFTGSCNSVRSLCSRLLPTTPLLEETVPNSNYSSPDFSAFPGESAAKDHIRSLVPDSLDIIDLTSSSQHDLQRLLNTKLSTTILEKASLRDCARLNTISAPHAGAWLRAIPNPNLSLAMPQREFIIAVCTWLGIPFFPPPPSSKRCSCGQVLDSYGDHLLGCGEGNWRNRRHNTLADVAFEALLSDNANCSCEQRLCGDSNARPGDIYHPDFERGRPTYFDITVRNSLQPTYMVKAACQAGVAAEAGEREKDSSYKDIVSENGGVFYPLVVESLGLWSPSSLQTLKSICRRTTFHRHLTMSQAMSYFHQRLSIKLWLYNAKIILERLSVDCSDDVLDFL